MSESPTQREDFLSQATSIIVENATNEQFGVSELAEAMNMSRSNLLRKIKAATNLSASVFIRQVRLEIAMDLLKEGNQTISEISDRVGFGSVSYFIKCFRELYGFSPGELSKQESKSPPKEVQDNKEKPKKPLFVKAIIGILALAVFAFLIYQFFPQGNENQSDVEKSIAVLPFKNESLDSSNLYFVNGLMESTLNNLQKINELRVVSRSSVEKYRDSKLSIPEIAEELDVSYFVTGSGQKVGQQVLLNIQLIDVVGGRQIWAEQYKREFADIFDLQNEIASQIAGAIKVIVTPSELEQIEKRPTENLVAYDYYLQGLDPFLARTNESLQKAIVLFKKAIDEDPEFSLAYANVAISYYLLEMFKEEKQFTDDINYYADKALLYDSKSEEGLCAKAFYYIQKEDYTLAQPYLEKAMEYNPNSALAIQMLADFYFRLSPNTEKYIEYALKAVKLQLGASDSTTQSYTFLQLSNALVSAGFVDEALRYVNKSLAYDSTNYYSPHLRAFILYAKDRDLKRTQRLLIREWGKDKNRLDILQDIGKLYYLEENYDSAYFYLDQFVDAREMAGLNFFMGENAKIGMVYEKVGQTEKAKKMFESFDEFARNDNSIYKNLNLAISYILKGKIDEAMEEFKAFSNAENFQFWFLMLEEEPIFQPLKQHPDFDKTMQKIRDRFWERNARIKKSLETEGLI